MLARFAAGTVLEPGCPDEEGALRPALLQAVDDEAVPLRHPRAGASFVVGDVVVDVLSPAGCFTGTDSDLNNDALVLRVRYGQRTVLFATEPEEPAQEEMLEAGIDLHADVLKVPHHGAATSNGAVKAPDVMTTTSSAVAGNAANAAATTGHRLK